jgi:hypothetical protein
MKNKCLRLENIVVNTMTYNSLSNLEVFQLIIKHKIKNQYLKSINLKNQLIFSINLDMILFKLLEKFINHCLKYAQN